MRLVAPIALYPDALVAQVFAACNPLPTRLPMRRTGSSRTASLTGTALANAVNQQIVGSQR